MVPHETKFLQAVFSDETQIDKATQAGLTARHFTDIDYQRLWQFICDLRLGGQQCDFTTVYTHAVKLGKLADFGGAEKLMEASSADFSSLGASACLASILEGYARREAWKTLRKASELLERESSSLSEVGSMVEGSLAFLAGKQPSGRTVEDLVREAELQAEEAWSGKPSTKKLISCGLPKVDRFMGPIEPHEYSLVCARPSRGKSSLLSQYARFSLLKGYRVAYFTLETSDAAVVRQIAGQHAQVNLKEMREWMPDQQRRYRDAMQWLREKRGQLLVFDKDMTLDALTSRCRLLANSFKPDLVLIDYLGLLSAPGKSIYERVSAASKAMIPLRKTLGCALIVGQQLKRAEDKEREPGLEDLRDSGQLEEDAHRVQMLHWKDSRYLDQQHRPYKFLQPKCRDGISTAVDGLMFNAPLTTFYEEGNA